MQKLQEILKLKFWLEDFREWQKEIIESVISKKDTLVFMPTGGWKSLTYQLPWVVFEGLTLVISPLISLMKDQVDKLNELWLKAELLNSTTDSYDKQIILNDLSRNDETIKFLYIAPERLNNEEFLRVISKVKISLVAIDEAHCISQWWHDFRPSYMKINSFLDKLKQINDFSIIALTATATAKVRKDIVDRLWLKKPEVFTTWFDRKNISLIVREISKQEEKLNKVSEILEKTPWSWIIYCSSRKVTKQVYEYLLQNNINCWIYTWEMKADDREQEQNNFMSWKYKVIVATNAFGMGIDKKDIRFVIHYNLPWSIENYYQEVGRAWRDAKNSYWVVLASYQDTKIQEFFLENSYPSKEEIIRFYDYLYKDFNVWEWKNTIIQKTYFLMTSESWFENDLKVWAILRVLEKYNILKRWLDDYETSDDFRWRWIKLLEDKQNLKDIKIDWKHQESLKTEWYFKLEQIKKLLFYPSCRKAFILNYFWDEEDLKKIWTNCWSCDFCIERKNIKSWEKEDIVKTSVFALILESVKKYDSKYWVQTFVKFFRWSRDKKLLEWKLDQDNEFGWLWDYTPELIKAIIDSLIEMDYLFITDWNFPLLSITQTWKVAIVKDFLLKDDNQDLQHLIRIRVGTKEVYKKQKEEKITKEKIDTYKETLKLITEWKDLETIWKERNLKTITIESHIVKLYEIWELWLTNIMKYTSFSNLKKVKEVISENSLETSTLKPIKEELEKNNKNDISYFDIKIAISMIEKKDL